MPEQGYDFVGVAKTPTPQPKPRYSRLAEELWRENPEFCSATSHDQSSRKRQKMDPGTLVSEGVVRVPSV
jgi:hypothetical protein